MSNYEVTNYDLEERLLGFAVRIIKVTESLPKRKSGNHIGGQLLRSGTSVAPNYAEALSSESRADFIHKLKLVLKELRESKVWLQMIVAVNLLSNRQLEAMIKESEELIAIFSQSVKTASAKKKS